MTGNRGDHELRTQIVRNPPLKDLNFSDGCSDPLHQHLLIHLILLFMVAVGMLFFFG